MTLRLKLWDAADGTRPCELYNWNSEERVLLKFYSELLETDASGRKESEQMSRAVANPQSQYQGQVLGAAPYS